MTGRSRRGARDRPDKSNAGLKLVAWAVVSGTLAVGVHGVGGFSFPLNKTVTITALVIHAIPVLCLMLPVLSIRVSGVWLGVFLVSQYLLSPLLLGDARDYKTLPPRMNRIIDIVGDDLPGLRGLQRITTDAKGFRVQPPIDYAHKRGFRIFAIGASTTEQLILDDRSTWTYLLQQQLAAETGRPVEVINTGLAGTRAIHQLATFRRILDYAPDCAMFLIGVNDWIKQIAEHFGSEHYRRQQAEESLFRWTLLGRALRVAKSYLARTLPGWSDRDFDGVVQINDGSRFTKVNNSLAKPDRRALAFDDVAHRAVIEEIGAACKAAGVPCVFLTQPHGYSSESDPAYRRFFWMTPPAAGYTLDLASLRGIADLYNRYLIRFADEHGHDVIDLAAVIPAGTMSFHDEVHFNNEGAQRVADVLTDELKAGACGFEG